MDSGVIQKDFSTRAFIKIWKDPGGRKISLSLQNVRLESCQSLHFSERSEFKGLVASLSIRRMPNSFDN